MERIRNCRLNVGRWLIILLFLLSTALATAPGVAQATEPGNAQGSAALHARVVPDFIVVREGRSDGTALVAQLVQGVEVTVIGDKATAGWWQVQIPDGRQGWVHGGADSVQILGADGLEIAVVSPAALAALAGTIVFQASSGGAIYAIHADGSNLHFVTNGMDPALSPDPVRHTAQHTARQAAVPGAAVLGATGPGGQWVAFTRWDTATAGLYIVKVDGTGERKLFAEPSVKSPSWSADGTQIAISHQNGGHVGAWEQVVQFPGGPGGNSSGGKNPTMTMIMPADARWKIGLVRVASGYFTDLASHDYSFSPSFSPAGQIAYASDKGISLTWENAPSAVSRDPNAGTVSTVRFNDRSPAWSPDGTRLAFQYKTSDRSEIYIMNADPVRQATGPGGSGRTALTQSPPLAETPVSSVSPAWSPDGTRIAYLCNEGGAWNIWVMDAAGGNPHALFEAGTLEDIEFDYQNVDERVLSWR